MAELVRRGIRFHNEGDYKSAIREFSEAIKLDHKNAQIYKSRGLAYFYDKQYDKAIEDYKRALKLEPDNEDIKRRLDQVGEMIEGSEPVITVGSVEKRFEQLELFLKKALKENNNIVLRENVAGTETITNTYICFGTRRMDEKFPQNSLKTGGHWNNGQQYYYFFHFENPNLTAMKGFFQLGPKRIESFDLPLNLNQGFSHRQGIDEINKTINAMLRWEDRYLKK
jgi:tetratricopeptide (TPR) repeat protein